MEIATIIAILVALVGVYVFIKLVLSPVVKAIVGVIIFLILLYLAQKFFGFGINNILSPLGISLDTDTWNWLSALNHYIDQIKNLINFIWSKFLK